jgi:hypothetical protein
MERAIEITVGLFRDAWPPPSATPRWGCVEGGPDTLLRWLETQLGLGVAPPSASGRVLEYASLLPATPGTSFARSLATDRYSTASALLARRDELMLAGWDGRAAPGLPPLVNELAEAERVDRRVRPGTAERLALVLDALSADQTLPPHRLRIAEDPAEWPKTWRPILARLSPDRIPLAPAAAPPGSTLRAAQEAIGETPPAARREPDGSLRFMVAAGLSAAAEAVAAALAARPELLGDLVVCCEDSAAALALDAALSRRGLPTMGAAETTTALPVAQVLPLALGLLTEPVDPHTLMEFVSLPVSPIPHAAARALTTALSEMPGLMSRAWEAAVKELTGPAADPEGRTARRLSEWFDGPRAPEGSALPVKLVADCCSRVARWAAAYASALEAEDREEDLRAGLSALAGQAKAVADLAAMQEEPLRRPQLARLLEAAQAGGLSRRPREAAAGGPRLVQSLAGISGSAGALVWFSLATEDPGPAAFGPGGIAALCAAGIEVDDGTRGLRSLRAAEREGFRRVRGPCLAVSLPADEEGRPHPLWLRIAVEVLPTGVAPVPLDLLLSGGSDAVMGPFHFEREPVAIVPAPGPRPFWTTPPGVLLPRERESASSLSTRLSCPLRWVLEYAAKLRASPIARLPAGNQLSGSFCHQVLEETFAEGGEPPAPAAAAKAVEATFDARVAFDAAPLAAPAETSARGRIRAELAAATRTLVKALRAGGYRFAGFEERFETEVDGIPLVGFIDCLVVKEGAEAVIDFKYSGPRYQDALRDGTAVQLATYAAARAAAGGLEPAVAYLLLSSARLLTPEGSALAGAERSQVVTGGPAIRYVWEAFVRAIRATGGWLEGAEPVPAWPLVDPGAWPEDVKLLLDPDAGEQQTCRWCDYRLLCGLTEVR